MENPKCSVKKSNPPILALLIFHRVFLREELMSAMNLAKTLSLLVAHVVLALNTVLGQCQHSYYECDE